MPFGMFKIDDPGDVLKGSKVKLSDDSGEVSLFSLIADYNGFLSRVEKAQDKDARATLKDLLEKIGDAAGKVKMQLSEDADKWNRSYWPLVQRAGVVIDPHAYARPDILLDAWSKIKKAVPSVDDDLHVLDFSRAYRAEAATRTAELVGGGARKMLREN
ncbi:hypothetical protein ACGFX8_36515 [Streptomyces sp. NPDC048362]|uniref:hypothetical protein n=1 Tax=Streptomyces sp. NPDC048362 TaxID=3365539 RepID=UPI0037218EBD